MDLVTITCSRDIGIQELQSYSLNLMVQESHDHYVVVEDSIISIDQWKERLLPYYTRHTLHVIPTLVPDEYYLNDTQIKNGWHRSAVLKILISEKIKSKKYLILDSKNFFIREQLLNEWPIDDGNGIVEPYDSRTWNEVDIFCEKNSIPKPKEVYMSCTPFVFDTSISKEMTKFDLFSLFFKKQYWWSSELFLYSIFTQMSGNILTSCATPNVTFWNTERELTKEVLKDIYNWPNIKTFGLHRDILKIGIDIKQLIEFLDSVGLDKSIVKKTLDIYNKGINGN